MKLEDWPPSKQEVRRRVKQLHSESREERLLDLLETHDELSENDAPESEDHWILGHCREYPTAYSLVLTVIGIVVSVLTSLLL